MLQADRLLLAVIAESEVKDAAAETAMRRSSIVNVTVRLRDVNDNRPVIIVPMLTAANSSDVDLLVCARARPGDRLLRMSSLIH